MSNDCPLDKDRLDFTQCNDTILLRCPECTFTKKVLRHCKIFHNFPSLWWHIKQEHRDIIESRLQEVIQVLNSVFKAYKWNMLPKWVYSEAKIPSTTTSSLEFDGRPPRGDVLQKLRKIAEIYKNYQEYPNLRLKQIKNWATVVLVKVDSRTLEKYVNCITHYSKKHKFKGEYDVSDFCNTVGV